MGVSKGKAEASVLKILLPLLYWTAFFLHRFSMTFCNLLPLYPRQRGSQGGWIWANSILPLQTWRNISYLISYSWYKLSDLFALVKIILSLLKHLIISAEIGWFLSYIFKTLEYKIDSTWNNQYTNLTHNVLIKCIQCLIRLGTFYFVKYFHDWIHDLLECPM